MCPLQYFTNNNFQALLYLYRVKDSNNKAHITQQEVADALKISRVTMNKIIGELKEFGYLQQDGKHVGRYILTTKAINIVETFKNITEE